MSYRVLLVDDELHIRRAAEFKLKREFEVSCAEDGQEAWERILDIGPDLLITDVQMPRMNGLELIERVRGHEVTADLPVILLTAKGFELRRDEFYDTLNIFRLVSKPFSPRKLCKLALTALGDDEGRQDAYASRRVYLQ